MIELLQRAELTMNQIEVEDARAKRKAGAREIWRGALDCVSPCIVAVELPGGAIRRVGADIWDHIIIQEGR